MDPLWNATLVAGFDDKNEPFLSYADLLGVTYTAPALATGFGSYLAIPLLRKVVDKEGDEKQVTEEQARAIIDECMKVLFYRDARSLDKYTVATITRAGIRFDKDVRCENMNWRFAAGIRGYGNQKE
jgi:20S proteasome subunit beta 7